MFINVFLLFNFKNLILTFITFVSDCCRDHLRCNYLRYILLDAYSVYDN